MNRALVVVPSGSLIAPNAGRLTKHALPLSDLLRTEGRHESLFGCKIGHVAENVLNACTLAVLCERGASRFDGASDLLRKPVYLVSIVLAFVTPL